MNKKQVLFLSSWYPTRINPTNGDFVMRHAQAVATVHDVTLIHVVYDGNIQSKREAVTSSAKGFTEYIIYFRTSRFFLFLKPLLFLLIYLRAIKQVIQKTGKPDVIHANIIFPIGIVAFLFSLRFRIPYIITEHWTGYLHNQKIPILNVRLLLIRLVAKEAGQITPISFDLQKSMQRLKIIGHYTVVNNVVDTTIFFPKQSNKQSIHRILHISSLKDGHKNISGILRVIQSVSKIRQDFVLDIVSENSFEMYECDVKKLGIHDFVRVHDSMNRMEIAAIMQQSSFFLLFSNYENFPCVIVEAFASGLPVLCSDVGGISEHLTSDKGCLVSKSDEQSLTEAIVWMLDNAETFDSQKLAEYAETNFSYQSVAKEFDAIYNGVIHD